MEVEEISKILDDTCDSIGKLLQAAKEKSKDVQNFVEIQLGQSFGPAIGIYTKIFKALEVKSREELEDVVKKSFRYLSVQESFENLLLVESSWDEFLKELDATLQGGDAVEKLSVGQSPPSDFCLINARTGKTAGLNTLLDYDISSLKNEKYLHLVLLRHFQ